MELLRTLPCVTRSVLVTCVVVHAVCILIGWDDFVKVCMAPGLVIDRLELWRPFSAIFFHVNVMHLVFNMMSWTPRGAALERALGTTQLLLLFVLVGALAGTLHTGVAFALGSLHPQLVRECAVGLSGIIFGLVVVDASFRPDQAYSIFGLFRVPARWYAPALALFLQLLMPGASFMGHASGIAAGYAFTLGLLRPLLPRMSTLERFEGFCAARAPAGARIPGFVPAEAASNPTHLSLPTTSANVAAAVAGAAARPWWLRVGTAATTPFSGLGRTTSGGTGGGNEVRASTSSVGEPPQRGAVSAAQAAGAAAAARAATAKGPALPWGKA